MRRMRRLRRDAGQTVTEYLMILGILTAIIIALTKMIAPAIADGMIRYMERRVVYNSSVADGGIGKVQARQGDVT
jgi:Flp pilus assembly pilin Flp